MHCSKVNEGVSKTYIIRRLEIAYKFYFAKQSASQSLVRITNAIDFLPHIVNYW